MFALQASLGLLVFEIGLHARPSDVTHLARHPALLGRSVLSMNVIMPAVAVLAATLLSLQRPVELALVALAASPVPPFLPLKTKSLPGKESYTVALLATESLLAIALVPATIGLIGTVVFARDIRVPPAAIARIVVTGILVPLAVGTLARRFLPQLAGRVAKPLGIVVVVLLAIGLLPLLVALWRPMLSLVGNGTLAAIAGMTAVGLIVGHALGGPAPRDRPVLALATATRHPAVAIAILRAAAPDEKLAPAAVLLALFVTAAASLPYTRWAKARLEPKRTPILITPTRQRIPVPARRRSDRSP
jgi:BASS family bile acid:Na+ symporter